MDPDGTIYFTVNLILSIFLCLYIAATRRNEDYDDFDIGMSNSIISSVFAFIINLGAFVYFTLPRFNFTLQCVFGALFIFIGIFMPYCIGLALSEKLAGLIKAINAVILVLNYTIALVIKFPIIMVFKIFKLETQTKVTQKDVMDLVDDASEDIIDDEQKEMIENIFELDNTTVGEIMTHRTEVFAVSEEKTCVELIDEMKEQGFSRVPVYLDTVDTITGILYIKDLLSVIGDSEKLNSSIKNLVRKPMFVPQSCPATDLLVQFKLKKTQMAIVVDEYGGTSGVITMEDILEEIVGNIQDEYDNEEEEFYRIDDNTIVCKASLDIEDALEYLDIEMPQEEQDEDFDTVGGLIIDRLARIPEQGENAQVIYMGVIFTVIEVADRRIVKVKLEKETQGVKE